MQIKNGRVICQIVQNKKKRRCQIGQIKKYVCQIGQNNEPNWPDWHVKVAWQTLTQSNEKIQGCVSYMILLRVSNSLAHTILSNNGLPC